MGFFDPNTIPQRPNLEPPGFDLLRAMMMQRTADTFSNPYGLNEQFMQGGGFGPGDGGGGQMGLLQALLGMNRQQFNPYSAGMPGGGMPSQPSGPNSQPMGGGGGRRPRPKAMYDGQTMYDGPYLSTMVGIPGAAPGYQDWYNNQDPNKGAWSGPTHGGGNPWEGSGGGGYRGGFEPWQGGGGGLPLRPGGPGFRISPIEGGGGGPFPLPYEPYDPYKPPPPAPPTQPGGPAPGAPPSQPGYPPGFGPKPGQAAPSNAGYQQPAYAPMWGPGKPSAAAPPPGMVGGMERIARGLAPRGGGMGQAMAPPPGGLQMPGGGGPFGGRQTQPMPFPQMTPQPGMQRPTMPGRPGMPGMMPQYDGNPLAALLAALGGY